MKKEINMSSTTRGTLFEKTVPLDPPQKLLIIFTRVSLRLHAFVAIFFMLLFSQLATAQNTGIEKQLEKLTQRLQLNEEQTAKVREILQEIQLQKETDRKTYKTDALALIQAAWTRRNHEDNKIEPILDNQQLEEYKALRKLHPVDRELFVLTEGLCLNDEQIFDVEGILINLYNEFAPMADFMEMMGDGGLPPGPPKGGGIGPGSGRGGMGGMPMGRGGSMMANMMKKIEAKKAKAIKKLLTDEQKELYEQIRKDRNQKMKERMKRMKERMKRE
jgi:hypothetical protein